MPFELLRIQVLKKKNPRERFKLEQKEYGLKTGNLFTGSKKLSSPLKVILEDNVCSYVLEGLWGQYNLQEYLRSALSFRNIKLYIYFIILC